MTELTSKDTSTSVYAGLADRLRRSIREGEFQPGQLIGSEHELARQQQISRVTVRRASEILVNEGLLERRPGKGLYVRANHVTTRMIQVIAGNLQWEPCLQVARGVQAAARKVGMQVQLHDAHGDAELDLEVVRQLPGGAARGAIIISFHGSAFNEAVFALKTQGFPFVLVDQRLHDIEIPSVTADNYDGGSQAAKAILKAGHRRIAFIGDLVADTVTRRFEGMRDAIGDAGLPFDRTRVTDVSEVRDRLGDWSGHVQQCVCETMGRPNPPTALFCSCDAVARSAYRALAGMGLRVPDDVSVVGFDDDPIAEWVTPGLTTVRQPFQEMGIAALNLLRDRMSDPAAKVEHRVLPVKLIHRGSLAPPRVIAANANGNGDTLP